MSNKAQLVEQVKSIQRSDPAAKQSWWDHCDENLAGIRDPKRHDAAVLEEFLAAYNSGGLSAPRSRRQSSEGSNSGGYGYNKGYDHRGPPVPSPPPPGPSHYESSWGPGAYAASQSQWSGNDPLAEMIKTGQRRSPTWKNAWQVYCSKCGNGFNDPLRYEEPFLVGFLDYIGQLVLQDMQDPPGASVPPPPEPPIGSGPSHKRPLGAAPAPPGKRQASTGAAGPEVQRRRAFDYDDSLDAEPSTTAFDSHAPGAVGDMPQDVEKAELVDRIKALQRSNPEAKQSWWEFCEEFQQGVKDPKRHDKAVLLKFLQGYD